MFSRVSNVKTPYKLMMKVSNLFAFLHFLWNDNLHRFSHKRKRVQFLLFLLLCVYTSSRPSVLVNPNHKYLVRFGGGQAAKFEARESGRKCYSMLDTIANVNLKWRQLCAVALRTYQPLPWHSNLLSCVGGHVTDKFYVHITPGSFKIFNPHAPPLDTK